MRALKFILASALVLFPVEEASAQGFSGPATITQPTTAGHCVQIGTQAGNNLVDSGSPCGSGGGGSPGGSNTQVQYNASGSFGGITGATTDGTTLTLVAPILGTPASVTLTHGTGLPITTGVSGLGTNVATFLATPTSANLAAAITNETGTGLSVFNTSPSLVTPVLGVATATSLNGNTLATASDAIALLAATQTFTGKTYDTAGSGNVFKINGTTITGLGGNTATVASESGTITSGNGVKADGSGNLVDLTYIPAAVGTGAFVTAGISPSMTDFNLNCKSLTIDGVSQTVTLPALSGPQGGGCYVLTTPFNQTVTVHPNGTDLINGVNANVTVQGNTTSFITADATLGWAVPLGSSGSGGTPGGSNTQVQYNNSSAFGGISGVTSNGTLMAFAAGDLTLTGSSSGTSILNAPATGGGTVTLMAGTDTVAGLATTQTFIGKETFSAANALSNSTILLSGAPIATGGSGTTTFPLVYLNSGASPRTDLSTTGTFIGVNAPSGFSGNYVDFAANGAASVYSVASDGSTTTRQMTLSNSSGFMRISGRSYYESDAVGEFTVFSSDDNTPAQGKVGSLVSILAPTSPVAPVLTGTCTTGSVTGGLSAGSFTATCTAQTVIISFVKNAPHGWSCEAQDITTSADIMKQTATAVGSCTLTGTTVASDVVVWHAFGYLFPANDDLAPGTEEFYQHKFVER